MQNLRYPLQVILAHRHASGGILAATPEATQENAPMRVLDSVVLFANSRQAVIRHDGSEYKLRITSQNKLILTK